MATAHRLYVVSCTDEPTRLVQAGSTIAQAIRHCASQRYKATPAKPQDVAKLMTAGGKLEVAGPDLGGDAA